MTASAAGQAASATTEPPRVLRVTPRTITILATYRCTARCTNCCMDSSPDLRTRLSIGEIVRFIDEACEYAPAELIVFSGGECFLLGEDLNRAIEHASGLGLRSRCVTNGYWAKGLERGRKRLEGLREAGLNELNISTGDFHQQWVTQDAVVNAAVLGVDFGLDSTLISIELQQARTVSAATLLHDARIAELWEAREANRFSIIESPWMPMSADETIEQDAGQLLNVETLHQATGCSSVLTTTVVTPERRIGLCCGLSRELIPELNVAWADRTVGSILEDESRDFMKIWLFVDGPKRILAWAASRNPAIEWQNMYAHHCHACLALFQRPEVRETIRAHYSERVEDVLIRYSSMLRQNEALGGSVYG